MKNIAKSLAAFMIIGLVAAACNSKSETKKEGDSTTVATETPKVDSTEAVKPDTVATDSLK